MTERSFAKEVRVRAVVPADDALAVDLVENRRLVKDYSDPHAHGQSDAADWVLTVIDGQIRIKLKRVDIVNCDADFGNIRLFM
jgi:hypothetical protein